MVTSLRGFGNALVTTQGRTTFTLKIDGITKQVEADVVPNSAQTIPLCVGQPFTELSDIVVFKDSDVLQFHHNSEGMKVTLFATKKTIVPPNYVANIKVNSKEGKDSGNYFVDTSVHFDPEQELVIPAIVIGFNDNEAVIPVINLGTRDLVIGTKHPIARACRCIPETCNELTVRKINRDRVSLSPLTVDDLNVGDVSTDIKNKLQQLVSNFRHCFATSIREIGQSKNTEMHIALNTQQPFTYRPYRMSPAERNVAKEMVQELLDVGIVRESTSPFSSPILLVKKKDGKPRLCVDYRKLNNATVKDKFPLPRIDDQIDRLHGAVYYSTLDLVSGYHQIPLEEKSKQYTAFVTPDGHFEYNKMPFGLCNAPSVFQRMMNNLLAPFDDFATVYLDDILIYSRTPEENLAKLERLLQALSEEGLTLNPDKCSFLCTSVNYLGYEISGQGVQPGKIKSKAIENFPQPKDIRTVRQFLGLTGFFRHFVKNYALITEPITRLTRKNERWNWGADQVHAFQNLKDILSSRPVLKIYTPDARTEVHTDACSRGLGGILLQELEGKLHPVFYYSRRTTEAESKYHSYELETLAVVQTVQKFRVYLLDKDFVVVTDCNALKTSWTKRDLLPRIARWWLQLQEFRFTIEYRKGKSMMHVDALSRNPDESEPPNEPRVVLRIEPEDWVLSAQLTDEKIDQIRTILAQPPESDYDRQIYRNYAIRDNRVFRITARGLQWVVPKGMRSNVIRAAHDELGHFALEKTLRVLCKHYWFPSMKQRVQSYISSCILYQNMPYRFTLSMWTT